LKIELASPSFLPFLRPSSCCSQIDETSSMKRASLSTYRACSRNFWRKRATRSISTSSPSHLLLPSLLPSPPSLRPLINNSDRVPPAIYLPTRLACPLPCLPPQPTKAKSKRSQLTQLFAQFTP